MLMRFVEGMLQMAILVDSFRERVNKNLDFVEVFAHCFSIKVN